MSDQGCEAQRATDCCFASRLVWQGHQSCGGKCFRTSQAFIPAHLAKAILCYLVSIIAGKNITDFYVNAGPIASVATLDIPTFEPYLLWRKLIFKVWVQLIGYFCNVVQKGHMSVTLSHSCRFGKDADNFYLPLKDFLLDFISTKYDALTKSFGYTDPEVLFVRPSATVLPRYQPHVPAMPKHIQCNTSCQLYVQSSCCSDMAVGLRCLCRAGLTTMFCFLGYRELLGREIWFQERKREIPRWVESGERMCFLQSRPDSIRLEALQPNVRSLIRPPSALVPHDAVNKLMN